MIRSAGLILLLSLALLSAVGGQSSSTPEASQTQSAVPGHAPPPPVPAAEEREITLDVQVTDKAGAPVRGLAKEDFSLRNNSIPQAITSFYAVNGRPVLASDPPVEVIMVVDNVNAVFRTVSFERDELKRYLLRNGGELPHSTSLVVVTDTGIKLQKDSSQDGKSLAALYDQYEIGLRNNTRSQGFYGAADRTTISLNALNSIAAYEETKLGRKLVIWISPGWPLLSSPNVELSTQNEKQIFHALVGISTALRRARITLYDIDPLGLDDAASPRTQYYKEFLKPVTSPSHVQIGNLGLQVLAVESGGAVFNSSNDLAASMVDCVSDADSYYVLTFNPSPSTRPDEYRSLEVTIEKPGVTVRTRTGYYAQP
jgi:VWFA-related protein